MKTMLKEFKLDSYKIEITENNDVLGAWLDNGTSCYHVIYTGDKIIGMNLTARQYKILEKKFIECEKTKKDVL